MYIYIYMYAYSIYLVLRVSCYQPSIFYVTIFIFLLTSVCRGTRNFVILFSDDINLFS